MAHTLHEAASRLDPEYRQKKLGAASDAAPRRAEIHRGLLVLLRHRLLEQAIEFQSPARREVFLENGVGPQQVIGRRGAYRQTDDPANEALR
jgi:hypothetical protein